MPPTGSSSRLMGAASAQYCRSWPILDDIRNWFCSQSFAMLARRIA
jgi:hypothetical protein